MKATLAHRRDLQPTLDDAVVLVLDAADVDFQSIVGHYGIPVHSVPMVDMVGPDDQLFYAQSGAMEADEIRSLVASTLEVTGRPIPEATMAAIETRLDEIRAAAKAGDLLAALRLATPLAESSSSAQAVQRARSYHGQIVTAIGEWLVELDGRMARGKQIYEAAYHVAKIYAYAPAQCTTIRQNAWDLINEYEAREDTRIAIMQAKHLVRARAAETNQQCDTAVQSYRHVATLDPNTPAGKYASQRIPLLQKRQATKLTEAF
jgi:hypothetical protein